MRPEAADLFREIVNIGASQSSGALATQVGRPVRITVPMLREMELDEAAGVFGPPTDPVEAVLILVEGTFRAGLLLALPEEDGRRLRVCLGMEAGEEGGLEAPLVEVLQSFVDACAIFLMADLKAEVTQYLRDMAGSLVPSLLAELGYEVEQLWLVEVDFVTEGTSILGRLFFLAGSDFYGLIDEMAG
ncbi:MAG: hypothetical protein ACYC5Q_15795 [Thermoleophilia bacterium]